MANAAKKSENLRIFIIVFSLTVVTLFFVWTRLQNIRLKREMMRLKQVEQQVNLENNRLQLEWARLTSPKRLEEVGAQKYNLHRPRPDQVVVLKEPQ